MGRFFSNEEEALQYLSDVTGKRVVVASKMKYLGQCDRLRKESGGESAWQEMMQQKKPISLDELQGKVDVSQILDEDESIEEFIADDPEAQAYESVWEGRPAMFLQKAGFEFIWSD